MGRYVLQRLLLVIPTLLGVTIFLSVLVRVIPGGAASAFCADGCTQEQTLAINASLGLDRPLPVQYVEWIGSAVRGDLGEGFQNRRSVAADIRTRLPVTMQLGLMAMIVAMSIALPIGILSAIRQDSALDYIARGSAIAWLSVPSFFLATLIIAYGGNLFGWAPPLTYKSFLQSPLENIAITFLPAVLLGAALSGTVMRLSRAQMLEVMRQDYIRTAWSKGLREPTIIARHAVRNAFIPVITLIGLQVPIVFGGSVILETIFNIPGVGRYLVTAIGQRDYPIIQGVNLVIATVVVMTNLLVDVSYSVLDPRVRYS